MGSVMRIAQVRWNRWIAPSLALMLALAPIAHAQQQPPPQQDPHQPLREVEDHPDIVNPPTEQERVGVGIQGATHGRNNGLRIDPQFIEGGGERDSGQVRLNNGAPLDINKVMPGADRAKGEALYDVLDKVENPEEGDNQLDSLRKATETREEEILRTHGAEGRAIRTLETSSKLNAARVKAMEQDQTLLVPAANAINQGKTGNLLGEVFGSCQTQTDFVPIENEWGTYDEHICERIVPPSEEDLCTREYVRNPFNMVTDHDKRALLNITGETAGEICRLERQVETSRELLSQSRAGDLNMTQEEGGLSCRRFRWATEEVETLHREKVQELMVNDEMGGLSCTRERWLQRVPDVVSGSRRATLTVDGQTPGLVCTRSRWPTNTTSTTNEVQDSILNINREENNRLAGERWRWPSTSTVNQNQTHTGTLTINTEPGGLSCTRTITPNNGTQTQSGSTEANLAIDSQAGGNLCQREIWPTQQQSQLNQSHVGFLPISGDTGGASCTRQRWASASNSSQNMTQNATLNVNNEQGGEVCRRWRWVTSSSGTTNGSQSHSQSGTNLNVSLSANIPQGVQGVTDVDVRFTPVGCAFVMEITQQPTAANGWTLRATIHREHPNDLPHCPSLGSPIQATITWRNQLSAMNWSVQSSGNCNDPGSQTCPTAWSCAQAAPTTINGISVSAADVNGLAQLYPGASSSCVEGVLARTCSSSTTGNSISLTVPPGTTSISNLTHTVLNPQPGISVALTGQPTAGNGWTATFQVTRTNYTYTPQAPQIRINYTAVVGGVAFSVSDSGNCADPGSGVCPTQWSCDRYTPGSVNGINVTSAMVSGLGPLYPGGSNTCLNATLSRVCAPSQTTGATIGIGHLVPGGTTSITNFVWSVTNPQSGVSVSMTQQPSLANGWTASFNVTRTNFTYTPAQPRISMTWTVPQTTTSTSIRDIGNCSQSGTPQCPGVWACIATAPTQINGIMVTAAMAAGRHPLFPGSTNSACTRASYDRACSGTATGVSQVSIASLLPPGTTAIRNYTFVVLNPQNGVTVQNAQTPSAANGWVARFNVSRTNFTYQPVAPRVRLAWDVDVPVVNTNVVDQGNCLDPGSQQCPTQWSCTSTAPTVINGITVTPAMAQNRFPLYTGATSNLCVTAQLNRVCNGTTTMGSTIGIGHLIPGGVTTISNFTWTWLNQQSGVAVTLVAPPSLANGWTASFNVQRGPGVTNPMAPQIRLNWGTAQTTTNMGIQESGNVGDVGTAMCPTQWSCTQHAPATVNGIQITAAMATSQPLLFPNAPPTCIRGQLRAVCSGTPTTDTNVSIASHIAPNTTSISNFAFSVLNPQANATVALLTPPSAANNWVATFRSTRTNWTSTPAQPQVRLTWNQAQTTTNFEVLTSGDCNGQPTPNCPLEWSCTMSAPTTVNGIAVTVQQISGLPALYPGSAPNCMRAELNRVCSGSAQTTTQISIADLIPPGTTAISRFSFVNENPQNGVVVTLVSQPSLSNSWVATFRVTRSMTAVNPVDAIVNLMWEAETSALEVSVREVGDCDDPGSTVCPTRWSCDLLAPATVNGEQFTVEMTEGLPALYPSAPDLCLRGLLNRVCQGSATVSTTISIADLIPAGATSIRNLAFEVLNPQDGITVQLMVEPTFANGWLAFFEVVRTDFTEVPDPPNVRVTFDVDEVTIVMSTRDEGDCADPGSPACPTEWSCAEMAPAEVNGIQVTTDMVRNEPLLYPNADALCIIGELRRECDGTSDMSTEIPIGDLLPGGTQEIQNFAWVVDNPHADVTVTLAEPPSLANGWVARFTVTRSYASGSTPPAPHVTMTWQVLGPVEYDHSIVTIGDCQSNGTENCPAQWVCLNALPTDINGTLITQAILEATGGLELFPGEELGCAEAAKVRVCEGDGAELTEVDISAQIPEGVTELINYQWEVSAGGIGVTVTQVSPPTVDNGWIATFRTARSDWTVEPTQPEVYLTWQVGTESFTIEIIETGDCSVTGDAFCGVEWVCRAFAPGMEPDVPGDGGGGDDGTNPAEGTLGQKIISTGMPPPGEMDIIVDFTIADKIPPGITVITDFTARVIDPPHAHVFVGDEPNEDNGWNGTLVLTGRRGEPNGEPGNQTGGIAGIKLVWQNGDIDTGDGDDEEDEEDPIGGVELDGLPELYPGAPPGCVRAALVYDCSGINGGQVCHETAAGTLCEDIEGGQFDNCAQYRQREDCRLDRTLCNEDGQLETGGHCYIEANVYQCRTPVIGTDYNQTETTLCAGTAVTCLDGSCTEQHNEQNDQRSVTKAYATLAINENVVTDFHIAPPPTGGGGGPCPNCDPNDPGDPNLPESAPDPVSSALAQLRAGAKSTGDNPPEDPLPGEGLEGGGDWDPWSLPEGAPGQIEDSADYQITPPPGFDISRISFLKGKSQNCMKALGGLLNCCTQNVSPQETNQKWWETFQTRMRERWANVEMCSADEQEQGAYSNMLDGAGNASLNEGFTSMFENLAGGGTPMECGPQPTMEQVNGEYVDYTRQEIRPRLSWYCDEDEFDLASAKEIGNCYYLGDYCQTSILGVCIDKRQRHCCFNSPMTKMIRGQLHEQGIVSMGTAKQPRCGGISIYQMAQMNLSSMDTEDLEGRMVAAGIVPDLLEMSQMPGLEDLMTGTGSLIGNGEDRQTVSQRTNERLEQTTPGDARTDIGESIEHLIPETSTPYLLTPGEISFALGYRQEKRQRTRREYIKVTRTGGEGAVSARFEITSANYERASGFDIYVEPTTLYWGHGDTGVREIPIWIYAFTTWIPPGHTEADHTETVTFEFSLLDPQGGATIAPIGRMELVVQPQRCLNTTTGMLEEC